MSDSNGKPMWGRVEKLGKGTKAYYDSDKKIITFCFNRSPHISSDLLRTSRELLMKELRELGYDGRIKYTGEIVVDNIAEERIKIKMVKVKGVLEVRCVKPNGVKCIQDAFINAKKSQEAKDAKIKFCVIAAPRYSVEVAADNWKRAEELLEKVSESVVTNITKVGGYGSFKREK